MEKIRLGISTCLLGENVRYDGGHKLDRFLTDTLGQYVVYVPDDPRLSAVFPFQENPCIWREIRSLPDWSP